MESAIVKGASVYSIIWRIEKYKPNLIVINNLLILSFKFPLSMAWWDQVIVKPDEIRIIVFNKGMSKGLKGIIPWGGQHRPISIFGAKDEWK
jgi:hypothetical protein